MKLFYCSECHDVVKCEYEIRHCKCGLSCGQYKSDGYNATYAGLAIPLGFNNHSLMKAIRDRPKTGVRGKIFEAFTIPEDCKTMVRIED